MTKVFDLLPSWVYVAGIALVLGIAGVQTVRVAGLQADLAKAVAAAETLEAKRERAARLHAQEKLDLLDRHSAELRKADNEHAQKLAAAEVRARADAATVERLRKQIATFSRGGGTCQTPAAVADGREPAAEILGGLLGESLELLAEGRTLHELRDAEVKLLLDQIDADRAACSGSIRPRVDPRRETDG